MLDLKRSAASPIKLAAATTVILILQMVGLYGISVGEQELASPQLGALPADIDGWKMTGQETMEPILVEYLRPDDYIMRNYVNQDARASVSLFVAYFKSLRSNYGPHSPRACLPGAGWMTRSLKTVSLDIPGRPEGVPVNEYVLEKRDSQILVLYWYQNDRRVWAEEITAKLYILPDLFQYRRSDVSLVRVIMPLGKNDTVEASFKQSAGFCRALFPLLTERLAAAR